MIPELQQIAWIYYRGFGEHWKPAASVHVCASRSPDAAAWVRLSQLLDATLTNEVDRKASTSQSLALLRVAASVFTEIQSLQDLRRTFLGSMCVVSPCTDVLVDMRACWIWQRGNAVGLHFVTMRDVILLATRVNLIGPLACFAAAAPGCARCWEDAAEVEGPWCLWSILLDALQDCHAYMFSTLFCSWLWGSLPYLPVSHAVQFLQAYTTEGSNSCYMYDSCFHIILM